VAEYTKKHGVKFSEGYFYPGMDHYKAFTRRWYAAPLKTYLYFDPHTRSPYYWCEGHGVWYPVWYIETVPADAKGPGPVVEGGPGPGGPLVGENGAGPVGVSPGPDGGPVTKPGVTGGPVGDPNSPPPELDAPNSPGVAPPRQGSGGNTKPAGATSTPAVTQAQTSVARNEVKVPPGTFDDAIPEGN
jgi:hypothetical protein